MKPQKTVSPVLFVALNMVTLGFYQVYWGWRAWETVRRSRKIAAYKVPSTIRGIFLFISGIALFPYLHMLASKHGYKGSAILVRIMAILLFMTNIFYGDIDFELKHAGAIASVLLVESLLTVPAVIMHNHYVKKTKGAFTPSEINQPLIVVGIVIAILLAVSILVGH